MFNNVQQSRTLCYSVCFQTLARRSRPSTASFVTEESVPGSLTVFEPVQVLPSRITFTWELSRLEANGIITGFVIRYGANTDAAVGAEDLAHSKEFASEDRQGTIDGEPTTFVLRLH